MFKAFISYSHEVDAELAPALRAALQGFAKPWHRLRAIRVFQDSASLAVNPALWETVRQALDESEFLIVLASPQAARSEWVTKEIERWLERHSIETVLLVLTHGEVHWDDTASTFDISATDALPPVLLRAFRNEPMYLDLRWIEDDSHRSITHPKFRDAIAALSATIRQRPKDELIGEDVRAHRKARSLAWSAGALVMALALATSVAAFFADQQRREALRQRNTATARLLGVQAEQLLDQDPAMLTRSVLLAIEAVRQGGGPQAEQALRAGVFLLPRQASVIDASPLMRRVSALAFDPASGELAIGGSGGLGVWDPRSGTLLRQVDAYIDALSFASDAGSIRAIDNSKVVLYSSQDLGITEVALERATGRGRLLPGPIGWYATPERGGAVHLYPLTENGELLQIGPAPGEGERPQALASSGDGGLLATSTVTGPIHLWSLPSGQRVTELEGFAQSTPVTPVLALSPSGDRLAAARGETIFVWILGKDEPPLRITHGGAAYLLSFAPNGRHLATGGAGKIRIWGPDGREAFRIPYRGELTAIAFSADGKLFATALRDARVTVFELDAPRGGKASLPTGAINDIDLSPDARFLATAEDDGVVRVWDLETGQVHRRLEHPPAAFGSRVERLAFAADNSALTVSTVMRGATVRLLQDGTELARFANPGWAGAATLGPEGRLFAVLTGQRQTQVWDIRRGERLVEFKHGGSSWRPIVSPDGQQVLIKRKSEGFVFSIRSGAQVGMVEIDPTLEIMTLAFSPDSRLIALGGEDEVVTVYDWQADATVAALAHADTITRLAFTHDGSHLVTISDDGAGRIFSSSGWDEVARLDHPARVVALSAGVARTATADERGTVRIWEIPGGRLLGQFEYDDEIQIISAHAGNDVLGIAGRRILTAIDLSSGETVFRRRYLPEVSALRRSENGRYLAAGFADGAVEVWDTRDGRLSLSIPGEGEPEDVQDVSFSADGLLLATVAGEAHVWDLASSAETFRAETRTFGGFAAFSSDGRFLAVGGATLKIWDLATAATVMEADHDSMIRSVAFSPDGALVAAAGPVSDVARIWSVASGKSVRTIDVEGGGGLFAIAFHPDGARFITAARNGSTQFWSIESGREIDRVPQNAVVTALDITADGRYLATASGEDYLARIWALDSHALEKLIPHETQTHALALADDASVLATVDADGSLAIWYLDRARLIADACARITRNLTWTEWQQYFDAIPYRKTCVGRPVHPSFMQAAWEMALHGNPAGARAQLAHARELDPDLVPDIRAGLQLLAEGIDARGEEAARDGALVRAAQYFESAVTLAQEDHYDFGERARIVAVNEIIGAGIDLAVDGDAEAALLEFDRAAAIDPDVAYPARVWNDLCWFGVVYGYANEVLHACDEAVNRADKDLRGFFADARGVARMLTGDTSGAIADFEELISWAEDKENMSDLAAARRAWIAALRNGVQPLQGVDLLGHANWVANYRMLLGLRWQFVSIQ